VLLVHRVDIERLLGWSLELVVVVFLPVGTAAWSFIIVACLLRFFRAASFMPYQWLPSILGLVVLLELVRLFAPELSCGCFHLLTEYCLRDFCLGS
jgi:hypothetical protein